MFKSGFVCIVGRPNVGKSTLVNNIVKQKIAIISNKPQTTRNRIQGIYTDEEAQIIFIDTPGIHKPKTRLSTYMNKMATSSLNDVDIIMLLVNVEEKIRAQDLKIMEMLNNYQSKKFLVINKIDLLSKDKFIDYLNNLDENVKNIFDEIIPISALKDNNVDSLVNLIKANLKQGIKYYDDDMKSDHSDVFMVKEIIREKILYYTYEEIPHSVAIVIEKFKRTKNNTFIIDVSVNVERDSQKGIIIGKNGSKLKLIGTKAREELEQMLKSSIYLNIFVKVEKDWRNKTFQLNEMGYNEKDY